MTIPKIYKVYSTETGELLTQGIAKDCAKQLGLTYRGFYRVHYRWEDYTAGKTKILPKWRIEATRSPAHKGKPRHYYTVWRRKDDSLAAYGTAQECAKVLGYATLTNFYRMVTDVGRGKHHRYDVLVEDVEDIDDDLPM